MKSHTNIFLSYKTDTIWAHEFPSVGHKSNIAFSVVPFVGKTFVRSCKFCDKNWIWEQNNEVERNSQSEEKNNNKNVCFIRISPLGTCISDMCKYQHFKFWFECFTFPKPLLQNLKSTLVAKQQIVALLFSPWNYGTSPKTHFDVESSIRFWKLPLLN